MTSQRLAAAASIVAVVASVIAGFMLSGSPSEQRLRRLDERRLEDLQQLTSAVDTYWRQQRRLPANLDGLADGRWLARVPSDPVSGLPYRYDKASAQAYRLCADFDRAAPQPDGFWAHPRGPHCFAFDVARGRGERPLPRLPRPR